MTINVSELLLANLPVNLSMNLPLQAENQLWRVLCLFFHLAPAVAGVVLPPIFERLSGSSKGATTGIFPLDCDMSSSSESLDTRNSPKTSFFIMSLLSKFAFGA